MAEDKEAPKEAEPVAKKESLKDGEDVSAEFFQLCEGLEIGELVTAKQFKLNEVMSAIELMEPKMDVGVNSRVIKNLDIAISEGLYADDFPLQLAVMDATLAMIVAWLEGSSLGSTVWTNIMLQNVKLVRHPVFNPFCEGINLLVRNIHSLINNVGNLEELPEEFNPQQIFMQTRWKSRHTVIQMMRDQMSVLGAIGKTWKTAPRAEQICRAMVSRFEFVSLLLEMMGMLVPPEIEDPMYGHRRHMGDRVVLETDYPGAADDQEKQEKDAIKNDERAQSVIQKMVEEFGAKVAKDGVDQGVKEAVSEKCCGSEDHYGLQGTDTESTLEDDDDDDEDFQFKPNFQFGTVCATRIIQLAQHIHQTVKLGRRAPDNEDGDFSWLAPFEPKACVRMIPATFPRSVKVPSRLEAAKWWEEFAFKLQELIALTPASTKDLNMMYYFAKRFSLKADVFTRSLLQVCMFPVDSHILGDDYRTIAHPIEISLMKCYMPQVLDEESPVHRDPAAREAYNVFLSHMTKLAITIYGSFGCNLSRQRDRLEMAIEEISVIHFHAGRLENRTDEILLEGKYIDDAKENFSYQGTITFVFHNMLAITQQYFELGFRMDLYVPYEFPYIYWFLGKHQTSWMVMTLNRSKEIQMNYYHSNPVTKGDRKGLTEEQRAKRDRIEEELSRRMAAHEVNVENQNAFALMCQGIFKMSVILIRKNVFKMPPGGDEAEKLRFERRFEVFENTGCPLSVTYDQYKNESGTLIHINKANILACNFLKTLDLNTRIVEWGLDPEFPMYPKLQIKPKNVAPAAEPAKPTAKVPETSTAPGAQPQESTTKKSPPKKKNNASKKKK
ncbi:hypothetical protein CAEBREN_22535 [Caenorhabditis brenneri]|uniref:Protein MAK10 homolog n=1 Tax=Caenorhabditis brenneri TaxID=135651 RepID=G0PGS6_CAEBE|nr:hypothetical protein CAEBREN_22535 [Caenorhabditis brenneri]